jgi:hypothetical protein
MAGLVPAIHVFGLAQVVDARNKCGHDDGATGMILTDPAA